MALPELPPLLCRRLWVVSRVCLPSCRSPARLPPPRSHWSGWGSSSHVALLLWAFDSAAGLRKEWKKTWGLCFFPAECCLGIYFTATAVTVIRGFGHSQCFVFICLSQNFYLGNVLCYNTLNIIPPSARAAHCSLGSCCGWRPQFPAEVDHP